MGNRGRGEILGLLSVLRLIILRLTILRWLSILRRLSKGGRLPVLGLIVGISGILRRVVH